ncbi:MAG: pyrimidine-nucleoside phosphorylase [Firmicutes bacterium]|nr:pyrimidine-nucleoside phosphorylase [Bacillota bacterium]
MNIVDIIRKKRDGGELGTEEIQFFVDGITSGSIPDYQASAFAMAVFFQGMSARETADLTLAMAKSGELMDLSAIPGVKVDKHSTGGVADTTTLILAPLVASAGVPVAKMSGRGLGHTGGTVDKLESIPGYRTELSSAEFIEIVKKVGVSVIGQSKNLAPADKVLYALRDVTATIESIPLIASSIMSKKIAAGADAIVLDVKVGKGAFLKDLDTAGRLARTMVQIGRDVGRETVACLTDMNRPLGDAIGNSLEVLEAVEVLKGGGPERLKEICLVLGSQMLILANKGELDSGEARRILERKLASGEALETFVSWVKAQGGDPAVAEYPEEVLPLAPKYPVQAATSGYVSTMEPLQLGLVALELGAGRHRKDDAIDPGVGIKMQVTLGDKVEAGETLAWVYARSPEAALKAAQGVQEAVGISGAPPKELPLIYQVIS